MESYLIHSELEDDLYLEIPEEIAERVPGPENWARLQAQVEEEKLVVHCVLHPEHTTVSLTVSPAVTFKELQDLVEAAFNKRLTLSFVVPVTGFSFVQQLRRAAQSSSGVHQAMRRQEYLHHLMKADGKRALALDTHTLSLFLHQPHERRQLICRPLYALPPTATGEQKAQPATKELDPTKHLRALKRKEALLVAELHQREGHITHAPMTKLQEENTVRRLYEPHVDQLRKQRAADGADTEERFQRLQPKSFGPLSALEGRVVDALYTNGTAKRDATLSNLAEQYLGQPVCKVKQLNPDEIGESVHRLYAKGKQRRSEKTLKAEQASYPTAPPKILSKGELQESVKKLYTESLEHRNEKLAQIEQQTMFRPRLVKHVAPSVISAAVERLTATG